MDIPKVNTQKDNIFLDEKLLQPKQSISEIQETKKALTNDIIELSRTLFEEANEMVSREVKLRINQSARYLRMKEENNSLNEKISALEALILKLKDNAPFNPLNLKTEDSTREENGANCRYIMEKLNSFGSLINLEKITKECDYWEEFFPSIDSKEFSDFNRFINRCNQNEKTKLLKDEFVSSIIIQDIVPCLLSTSMNLKGCNKIIEAIFDNECVLLENHSFKEIEGNAENCALCKKNLNFNGMYDLSLYNKFSGFVDYSCRQKIVTCCSMVGFIRHLELGIYNKRPVLELYIDLLILKRLIFYARTSGFHFYTHFDHHNLNFIKEDNK